MMWILAACAVAFLTKFAGYLLPDPLVDNERVLKVAGMVTVGLLGSLIAINTFSSGESVAVDARLGALVVAVVGCYLRLPFLAVVILGAAVVALLRMV